MKRQTDQVQKDSGTKKPAEVRIPAPWFDLPKSFYEKLAAYAQEFGVTSAEFLTQSITHYAKELRERNSPAVKTLGLRVTRQLKKLASEGAKNWWSQLTPEQRSERAKKANQARWAKTAQDGVASGEESEEELQEQRHSSER
ncbi:MAG: hypothetical protein M3Y72_17920 [Acidobacteriota bacterium]|nr:hypothetical protein [Acidobacteriota bacterium]